MVATPPTPHHWTFKVLGVCVLFAGSILVAFAIGFVLVAFALGFGLGEQHMWDLKESEINDLNALYRENLELTRQQMLQSFLDNPPPPLPEWGTHLYEDED